MDSNFKVKIVNYQNKPSIFIYQENILSPKKYQSLLDYLNLQTFKGGQCISGKEIPRLQIWYHTQGSFFCDSWKYQYDRWKGELYKPILLEVQKIIEDKTKNMIESFLEENERISGKNLIEIPIFNSCLVNKYRNGFDSIKPHQDSSKSFGSYPTISNLSLASTRNMVVKPLAKLNKNKLDMTTNEEMVFPLAPNSLLIMAGASQKYFTHSIPKQNTEAIRYSLTFRQHIQNTK